MADLISRQAAIDASEKITKDCNPEHFIGQRKFIEFMDDAEIGSFGMWQFANGFNMGLTAAEVAIERLPSAQQDRSLWFRIGEICVDESKGFISSGRAVEKIRELLREEEPYKGEES